MAKRHSSLCNHIIGDIKKKSGKAERANLFLNFGRTCFGIKRSLCFVWLSVGKGSMDMFEKTSEMIKLCFKKVTKSSLFRMEKEDGEREKIDCKLLLTHCLQTNVKIRLSREGTSRE